MESLELLDAMPHRLNLSMGASSRTEPREPLIYEDVEGCCNMLSQMNILRKNGQFCDVIIRIGAQEIPAHRAVLAVSSPFLFELFSDEGASRPHFKLHGVEVEPFELLLNYAYTSRLEIPPTEVNAVYKTANLLKMSKAAEACSRWLATNLSPENCLGIRAFANSYCDAELTNKTDGYIQEHLTDIEFTKEFIPVPRIQVQMIGADDNQLNADNEKHLCNLVVDWMRTRIDEEQSLAMLCEHVHMLYLNPENNLQDCGEDIVTCNSEVIVDYKKLTKRRHVHSSAKHKQNGSHCQHSQVNGGRVHIWMERTDSPQVCERETKLVAFRKTADRNYLCIAVILDSLVIMSLHLRKELTLNGINGNSSDDETSQKCPSPTGSPVPLEKHASLTPLESMSVARCSLGAAILNGKIIAVGGYDRGECLSSVESYDIRKNMWASLPEMRSARGRFGVAEIDGKLYACGGSDGLRELATMEVFNPATGKWTSAASMTFARAHTGVTKIDKKLFVIGGWNGDKMKCVKQCDVYDPAENTWSRIDSLQFGRSQPAVCSYNGKVYCFGGSDAWNTIYSVEVYDPQANTWRHATPMQTSRRGAAAVVFKDKIYVVGGSDGTQSLCSSEIFDPETETWSTGPMLNTPRANLGLAVVEGRLFAFGGFSGKHFLDSMEYLESHDGTEWCACVPKNCCESP